MPLAVACLGRLLHRLTGLPLPVEPTGLSVQGFGVRVLVQSSLSVLREGPDPLLLSQPASLNRVDRREAHDLRESRRGRVAGERRLLELGQSETCLEPGDRILRLEAFGLILEHLEKRLDDLSLSACGDFRHKRGR